MIFRGKRMDYLAQMLNCKNVKKLLMNSEENSKLPKAYSKKKSLAIRKLIKHTSLTKQNLNN